jgi:hypothetical protein
MNRVVAYSVVSMNDNMVVIRDEYLDSNPTLTITNGVEDVVKELTNLDILGDRRLLYYDTDDYLDEILHESGSFKGFAPYRKV